MKEKIQNKIKAKHKSFKDELDDIVHKAANFIEKNFGKNLLFNRTTFDGEESEDEICDPESMQKTQNKCIVSTTQCGNFMIFLSHRFYVKSTLRISEEENQPF